MEPLMSRKRTSVAQGALYLAFSSGFFVVCSYLMHSVLGRVLQPESYGIFGLVFSVLVWLEILFSGTSGATVKMVAERPAGLRQIERSSLTLLLATAASVFALTFLFAPAIARAFNEPSLSFYLRIAIIDVPFLAVYRVYIALLNGLRLYGKQSLAAMVYVFAKSAVIIGLVLLGFSVSGALIGNVIASVFGLLLAFYFFRSGLADHGYEAATEKSGRSALALLAKASVPFTIYALLYNALMNVDLWMVQGLLSDSTQTGYYVAAVNLARALYFMLSALSLALFPAIAGSISRGDHARTRDYIRRTFRTLLVVLVPISVFMAVSSSRLVCLIYSSSYLPAAEPLVFLSFGYALFAIIIACLTILMADNDFKEVLIIEVFLVLLDIVLCIILVPRHGIIGAAYSTLATCLAGFIACAFSVRRNLGVTAEAEVFLKALAASILASVVLLLPGGAVLLLVYYVVAGLVYMSLLWLLKELKAEDLETLRGMFGGRR